MDITSVSMLNTHHWITMTHHDVFKFMWQNQQWNPNVHEGFNDITNAYIASYCLHKVPLKGSSSGSVGPSTLE
eukprot:6065002-Ditylum_brightwellii.AAC.1